MDSSPSCLMALGDTMISRRSVTDRAVGPGSEEAFQRPSLRVLLVEDDWRTHSALRKILGKLGWEVHSAMTVSGGSGAPGHSSPRPSSST